MWVQEYHHGNKLSKAQQRLSSEGSKVLYYPPSFLPLLPIVPLSQSRPCNPCLPSDAISICTLLSLLLLVLLMPLMPAMPWPWQTPLWFSTVTWAPGASEHVEKPWGLPRAKSRALFSTHPPWPQPFSRNWPCLCTQLGPTGFAPHKKVQSYKPWHSW